MGVQKVIFGNVTVIDTSGITVKPETMFEGETALNSNGDIQTGTFTIQPELTQQNGLIDQIKTALRGKAAGDGEAAKPEQEKSISITENGTYEILPDEGYALSGVQVHVDVESGGGASIDGIPAGYARCDYIEFSGNQWIDTGIIGNQDTEINTCFARSSSTQRYLFGCASSDNTAAITGYMAGAWRFGNKSSSKALGTVNARISYGALVNKSVISVAGATASISGVNDFETIGTILLGGCRGSSGSLPSVGFLGRVFYFVVQQGEEQALKLVPVTDGNGVYRFWDMVSKTFFDSITDVALEGGNL